jgi:hypothetical protein
MLGSLKVGCMSVAQSQAASNRGQQRYCTLALWGPSHKAPKQRTRLHTTVTLLFAGPPRLALVAEVVVDAVGEGEGGLTHLATEDSAATVGLLTHKTAGAASRRMSGGFAAGACWVQRLSRQATAETVLEGAALVGQVWLE